MPGNFLSERTWLATLLQSRVAGLAFIHRKCQVENRRRSDQFIPFLVDTSDCGAHRARAQSFPGQSVPLPFEPADFLVNRFQAVLKWLRQGIHFRLGNQWNQIGWALFCFRTCEWITRAVEDS